MLNLVLNLAVNICTYFSFIHSEIILLLFLQYMQIIACLTNFVSSFIWLDDILKI